MLLLLFLLVIGINKLQVQLVSAGFQLEFSFGLYLAETSGINIPRPPKTASTDVGIAVGI